MPALPPAVSRFDTEVIWFANVPAFEWSTPGRTSDLELAVLTRVSAVLSTVFNRKADLAQELLEVILIAGLVVFALVEVDLLGDRDHHDPRYYRAPCIASMKEPIASCREISRIALK